MFEYPAANLLGLVLGFVKFTPHVGVTGSELDLPLALQTLGEAAVGSVAIALDNATKVARHDLLDTGTGPAGVPVVGDVAARLVAYPQVAVIFRSLVVESAVFSPN